MEGEKTGTHRASRHKKSIVIVAIAVMLLGGVGGVIIYMHARQNPFPASVRAQVSFPLYYPTRLPQGWQVDKTSYATDQGVLFYRIKGPGTTNVVVTTQARPPQFAPETFYKQQMKEATFFDATSGDGAIGKVNNKIVGSMFSDRAWVLLSPTAPNITNHDLREIVSSLQQY